MSYVLFARLKAVIHKHPELKHYERHITGSCCRRPRDERLLPRIRAFAARRPEFAEILRPLLEPTQ